MVHDDWNPKLYTAESLQVCIYNFPSLLWCEFGTLAEGVPDMHTAC